MKEFFFRVSVFLVEGALLFIELLLKKNITSISYAFHVIHAKFSTVRKDAIGLYIVPHFN